LLLAVVAVGMHRLLRLVIPVVAVRVDCKSEKYQSALMTHFQSQSAVVAHRQQMDQTLHLVHIPQQAAVAAQMVSLPLVKMVEVVAAEAGFSEAEQEQPGKVLTEELVLLVVLFILEAAVVALHHLVCARRIPKGYHRAAQV
jgi:hypothetical protein